MRGCNIQFWKNVIEFIIKTEKTNTMTNIWGKAKTETKTDKDKNVGEYGITVKFSNQLQRHPVSSIFTTPRHGEVQ